jgi:RHS repeat-associated protein
VLPPASGADAATSISQTTLDNLCYQYRYDERNRLSQKKIPGKGWEYIVYNQLDQPVLTQDAVQRTGNQWTVTKYDGQGRVIMTGLWNAGSQIATSTLQASIYAGAQWDARDYNNTSMGYNITSYPATLSKTLTINYYDDYNYTNITSLPAPPAFVTSGYSTMTKGLLTATKTAVLNTLVNTTPDMLWTAHCYDDLGRNSKSYNQHYFNGALSSNNYDAVATTYNFNDQPTTVTRQHWYTASTTVPLLTTANTYYYDHMGRKRSTWEQITNGSNVLPGARVLISKIDYNEIGQVLTKHLHGTDSLNFYQDVAYTYNERGWLLTSSAPLFAMQLYYNTGSRKAYNGNILYQYWGTPGSLTNNYSYVYDILNRFLYNTSSASNYETGIAYDLMGNINTLKRYQAGTLIDNLGYTYTGNQLTSINDATTNDNGLKHGTWAYTYDGNGNLITDPSKGTSGISIAYNLLNLPQSITGSKTITYTYDATGNKLRRVSPNTGNTDYINGIEYDNNGIGNEALSFIQTEEGKAVPITGTSTYNYTYYLGDNLGNTRVTFDTQTGAAAQIQKDDYYPFGMEIYTVIPPVKNEYLYNKKELQEELGEYDYGARFYDPVIGRWNVVDAYAEHPDQIDLSPYAYVGNNPITRDDPDGNCPPCGVMSESDITGNDMSIVENIFYSTRDIVTSSVGTLVSGVKSMFGGGPMKEASFDYSGGQRTLQYYKLPTTTDKLEATGNALLGLTNIIPIDGPAAGLFAKTSGVKSSLTSVVKDVVHANSKSSKLENTLYRLETKTGEYLKTGVTSKAIPEKRYTAKFMKDKVMKVLHKGSRASMLKKERKIVEKSPGPLNKEPWAGAKIN